MRRGIILPGSTPGEEDTTGAVAPRFTPEDVVTLSQVAMWWRYRLARADAADPVASLLGGVDCRGTATTVGLTDGEVALTPPLAPGSAAAGLIIHALGRPATPGAAVYSLLALAHVCADPAAPLAAAVTLGRLPAGATIDLLAAVAPGTNAVTLAISGVAGQTIAWVVDVYRLEG